MIDLINGALRLGLAGGMALALGGVVSPDTVLARSSMCLMDGQPACRISDLAGLRQSVDGGQDRADVARKFAGDVVDASEGVRSRLAAVVAAVASAEVET